MKRQFRDGKSYPPVSYPILQCMAYLSLRSWPLYESRDDALLNGHIFTLGPVGAGKTVTDSQFIRDLSALTKDRPAAYSGHRLFGGGLQMKKPPETPRDTLRAVVERAILFNRRPES